jgi:hypothetical protein
MPVQPIEMQVSDLLMKAKDFDDAEVTLVKQPKLMRHVLYVGWETLRLRAEAAVRIQLKRGPTPNESNRHFATSLWDRWRINGKSLGECTAADLDAAISRGRNQISGLASELKFHEAVRALLPDDSTRCKELSFDLVQKAHKDAFG